MYIVRIVPFVLITFLSGCATITGSEYQSLNLSTKDKQGNNVDKVVCSLKNDKGLWQATSPSIVNVHRSSDDLTVECNKEGIPSGFLRAISRAGGGMFGNIIFGGGIGAIIDHSKGTGYNYPDNLPVVMGDSVTVDRAKQSAPENTAGKEKTAAKN